jgi:hypothetical protein
MEIRSGSACCNVFLPSVSGPWVECLSGLNCCQSLPPDSILPRIQHFTQRHCLPLKRGEGSCTEFSYPAVRRGRVIRLGRCPCDPMIRPWTCEVISTGLANSRNGTLFEPHQSSLFDPTASGFGKDAVYSR